MLHPPSKAFSARGTGAPPLPVADGQVVSFPLSTKVVADVEIHQTVVSLDPEVGQVGGPVPLVASTVSRSWASALFRVSVSREELQSRYLGKPPLPTKLAGVLVTAPSVAA